MADYLQTSIPIDQLYPPDAAFMGRTNLDEVRLLGYGELNLDTITSHLMGLLQGRSTIRHEAAAGEEIIGLFLRAGIKVDEEIASFETAREAVAQAEAAIERGKRLFGPYPLPDGQHPEQTYLVDPTILRGLNAKINLSTIVPKDHLPARQILTQTQLSQYEPTGPVVLKPSGQTTTGAGFAVKPCPCRSSFNRARKWYADYANLVPELILEEWVDTSVSWGVGLAISDQRTLCFGGAEQIFAGPAQQHGSVIDAEFPLPEEVIDLAITVGETAQKLGFRGIAGLDIGLRKDERPIVFDPNFRFTASTSQLLFHESASQRVGSSVSHTCEVVSKIPFRELARRLENPIGEGWFVPTRLFNGEKHPLSTGNHIVTGFTLGETRHEAEEAVKSISAHLSNNQG